jgi:hypothetical protein
MLEHYNSTQPYHADMVSNSTKVLQFMEDVRLQEITDHIGRPADTHLALKMESEELAADLTICYSDQFKTMWEDYCPSKSETYFNNATEREYYNSITENYWKCRANPHMCQHFAGEYTIKRYDGTEKTITTGDTMFVNNPNAEEIPTKVKEK